jgi:hypothetical protein
VNELRFACQQVAARARSVGVDVAAIPDYAAALPGVLGPAIECGEFDGSLPGAVAREHACARWLALDAINFGSGWFPTLRKRDGLSGYNTVALYWREHHERHGPFTARELAELDGAAVAELLGQDAGHELMTLYATSLNDLGAHVEQQHDGRFANVVDAADGSAVRLARTLGGWGCFADVSRYYELEVPFLKRAQIAAADLHRAGAARFTDLDRLTMFADNLVPHVLRLDGVLTFDSGLVQRIDAGQLIEHGSPEEVEIRACAVHAVELIVDAHGQTNAAAIDELLWQRGQQPSYKARPRHRSRCSAY